MKKNMLPVAMRRQKTRLPFFLRLLAFLALILGALSVSTQTFAWITSYSAALGSSFWGIYPPWKIIQWGISFAPTMPSLFICSASAGVIFMGVALLLILPFIRRNHNSEVLHGSARWADKEDIQKAGMFAEEGVYIGGWEDERGRQHYLRHNGSEHILCIAPTRSGKGICLVIPTLLSWRQSAVITDLKGELWALTSGWRKKHAGNTVLLFEPASNISVGWNPLDEIRLETEYELGDTQNLATMIVDPDGQGLKDHWQKTAQALLVGCILHLLYKRKNEGDEVDASLPGVDAMLADPTQPIKELWPKMIAYQHLGKEKGVHPAVAKAAQDMIDRPDEEAGSVLSTAKSYLALFRDPIVAANVRFSGFHIKDLATRDNTPVSLYIVTQPADKVRLRPLVRILINMICRVLAGKMTFEKSESGGRRAKSENKQKLLMMLDEFPSLGKLEIVQESLAFLAGYGIRFYLICQDLTQLKSEQIGYGRDEAISSNCHIQNAFQPNRIETAEYLSKMIGTTTVIYKEQTYSGGRTSIMFGNVSQVEREVSRALMTPDECMRMSPPEKREIV